MTARITDAFAELNEIETFVRVRKTLDCAEEGPRLLNTPALAAMQHAYILKDLRASFGRGERVTGGARVRLARIRRPREMFERIDPGIAGRPPRIVKPPRGTF